MSARFRRAWRRFLVVIALIGFALSAMVVSLLPYEKSPLRIIDTSYGAPDPGLCDSLERALNGGVDRPASTSGSLAGMAIPLDPISEQEFRTRVEAVPGWDQLVAFPPYQRGEELTLEPAISSWWLKRQLRNTGGVQTEHLLKVLVVRDQKVVGSLFLETDLEIAGVVSRDG